MANRLMLENGVDALILESGTGALLQEAATATLLGIGATASFGAVKATIPRTLVGKVAVTGLGTVVVPALSDISTFTDAFRVDVLCGRHAFGSSVIRAGTTADTFKAALYFVTASRNETDTIYTATGEVTGTNYTAGGVVLANTVVPAQSGGIAYWTPSSSAVFTNVTISTAFNCMVLYNNTSTSKLEVAVFVFGAQTVTAGDFTLQFAPNNSATGLVRLM